MVILTEQIDIPAPFERLCQWAKNFETEFVKWSPYHLEYSLLDGGVEAGNRVRFYEIVMGLDYDVTGTITESVWEKDRFRFVFQSDNKTAMITFEGNETESGCRFSHTEAFGSQTPILGAILNFIFFRIIYRKECDWQLIRQDMALDNRYLKDILTEGKYPERIPMDALKSVKK